MCLLTTHEMLELEDKIDYEEAAANEQRLDTMEALSFGGYDYE